MEPKTEVVEQVKGMVTKDLIWGNSIVDWAVAASIVVGAILIVFLVRFFSKKLRDRYRQKYTEKVPIKLFIYSNLCKTKYWVAVLVSQYFAFLALLVTPKILQASKFLMIVAIFVQILIWVNNTLDKYGYNYIRKNPSAATSMNVFSIIWKIVAFSLILLVMLDQLGFNITALLAGLGIGGIAVAFALQNVLSDVFGSMAIILDKPFKIGDMIQIGNFTGRVERVGLKTTRVRSLVGELLVFSNNELLKSTIQNYGGQQERRVIQTIGVTYETPYEKLEMVPQLIRDAIFSRPNTTVDRVTLRQFADSSLNFEIVYFIQITPEKSWLDIEHEINMEIVRNLEKEGISFAYPTRTVYTKNL